MKKRQICIISIVLIFVLACVFLVACDGRDGRDGKSAYDLALEQGFEGTLEEWLDSLKGANGASGNDGVDGKDGKDGRDGIDGIVDIEELYSKAVEKGFDGSYLDFLNSYLTLNSDFTASANLALLSAVKVRARGVTVDKWGREQNVISSGSGVIYKLNKELGSAFIITNYHVVYNSAYKTVNDISDDIDVFLYGYENETQAINAKYIGGAYEYDIAILQVSDSHILKNSDAREVDVAESKDVTVGSAVLAVGNPSTGTLNPYEGVKFSVTQGIVSVDSENVSIADTTIGYSVSMRVMRVDSAINSGNSGGGLFNAQGKLIGIVNAKATSSGIENMGYAIPVDVAVGIADYAIDNCDGYRNSNIKKLVLGIGGVINSSKSIYDSSSKTVKVEEEIAVGEVSYGSVASGLLQEGDILKAVEFDGNKYDITRSFSLPDVLWKAKIGITNSLKFYITRDGKDMTVDVAISVTDFAQLK